jgi:putative addiction module killer protein
MIRVRMTAVFEEWLVRLKDREARRRILLRLSRIEDGNFGDAKPVGEGVSELRIDHGPGYRIYFIRQAHAVVILLCGGDKRSQSRDIRRAIEMTKE